MRMLAVALMVVLAGCGGGSDGQPAPAKTSAAPTGTSTKPAVASPEGTPAPEALSQFHCAKSSKGLWTASGHVANRSKDTVTFQVTVYVGAAAGGEEKAETGQVSNVAAGGSARFTLDDVPAPEDGGPCHVQVLAQR